MKKYKSSWVLPVRNDELPGVLDFCANVCKYRLYRKIDINNPLRDLPEDATIYLTYYHHPVEGWVICRKTRWSSRQVTFKNFDDFISRHMKRTTYE